MKKGFTLIELVVAVAILAMVIFFASTIFKVSIGAHRTAGANTEIMQKLRAITDQLNADFKGLRKDGYLLLHSEKLAGRREFYDSDPNIFRADRLYYFSTGDFQSWFDPDVRSNIARVYFGHDSDSLGNNNIPVSNWNLARDIVLLTPGQFGIDDCSPVSYAECKADLVGVEADANDLLANSIPIGIETDPDDVRRLMCENVGEIVIEWTDGTMYPPPANSLAWFGLSTPRTQAHPGIPADPNYATIRNVTPTMANKLVKTTDKIRAEPISYLVSRISYLAIANYLKSKISYSPK
ncbi:unnamed protein product [marine sediment metagenome]|uniref:Prepilin-type N-terminal cleavage/methylation domain-containing protein n=1 Tax=marine sediment metagenome TaxID=412755 RepID=X1ALW3_9ZZZZ